VERSGRVILTFSRILNQNSLCGWKLTPERLEY
jgi:hypothetical protein